MGPADLFVLTLRGLGESGPPQLRPAMHPVQAVHGRMRGKGPQSTVRWIPTLNALAPNEVIVISRDVPVRLRGKMTLGQLWLQPPLDPRSELFDRLFPSVDKRLLARVDQHRHWQDFHKTRAFWAGFHAADGSSFVKKDGAAGHQYTVDHRDHHLLEFFKLQLGGLGRIISSEPRKTGYLGYNDYVPGRTRAVAGAMAFLFGDFIHVGAKRAGAEAVAQ